MENLFVVPLSDPAVDLDAMPLEVQEKYNKCPDEKLLILKAGEKPTRYSVHPLKGSYLSALKRTQRTDAMDFFLATIHRVEHSDGTVSEPEKITVSREGQRVADEKFFDKICAKEGIKNASEAAGLAVVLSGLPERLRPT